MDRRVFSQTTNETLKDEIPLELPVLHTIDSVAISYYLRAERQASVLSGILS